MSLPPALDDRAADEGWTGWVNEWTGWVNEGAGDETRGDAVDDGAFGYEEGAGTAGDGALTWQQQTLVTRTCAGCETATPPDEGEVDEADGKWYCLGCWEDNNVAAVSPEEALAFIKNSLKGSHPQGKENQIMWREFLVENRPNGGGKPTLDPQRCD